MLAEIMSKDSRHGQKAGDRGAVEAGAFLLREAMAAVGELRASLPIDEDAYRHLVGYSHADPRSYYAYGALEEVEKALQAGLRILSESASHVVANSVNEHCPKTFAQSIRDEHQMWVRKLREALAHAILFRAANSDDYFRMFLVSRQLDAYTGLQRDFEDFFACNNRNAAQTITQLVDELVHLSGAVDMARAWFFVKGARFDKKLGPHLSTSFRQCLMKALAVANADERVALGPSYEQGFSAPSRSMHVNVGGVSAARKPESLAVLANEIAFIAINAVVALNRLTGVEPQRAMKALMTGMASSSAAKALRDKYSKQLDEGDLVFAYGEDLCQVRERATSDFGHTAYLVRYLVNPPLPGVDEDWFPSEYIHLVMPWRKGWEMIVSNFREVGAAESDIERLTSMGDDSIKKQLAESAAEMKQTGVLDRLVEAFREDSS